MESLAFLEPDAHPQSLPAGACLPDPCLSASLYASTHLDHAIFHVVRPFWLDFRSGNKSSSYIWLMRYARGGPHVKIRLHASPEQTLTMAEFLEQRASWYFKRWPREPGDPQEKTRKAPAIDREDQEEDVAPRTFLWTEYRRSHVTFGDSPLLHDDKYLALFSAGLGAACEIFLNALELGEKDFLANNTRQRVLARTLATGLASIFSPDQMSHYLAYHRDWIVRCTALDAGFGAEKARSILDRYSHEGERIGSARLRLLLNTQEPSPPELDLQTSLIHLKDHLDSFSGVSDFDLDPFTNGPLYPCLFKLLHSTANQLGVDRLNEGLVHHLLLQSITGNNCADHFSLLPV